MHFANIIPTSLIFAPEAVAARPLANPNDADYIKFLGLKTDLANNPILNVFSVATREDGFLVMDGNRRALACQQLWAEGNVAFMERYPEGIPVQVMDASDAEVLMRQISGNHNVNKQNAASLAKALYKVLLMTNITISDLARQSGMSEAYVTSVLKLNALPETVIAAIGQDKITATNAFQLGKLPTELLDDEIIAQAEIMSGADFKNLVDTSVKEFNKAKREGAPAVDGTVAFVPVPKVRMKTELEGMLTLAQQRAESEPTEFNIGYAECAKWCFRMDADTLESDKSAFELKKKEADEKKKARAEERENKKTEDLLASLIGNPDMLAKVKALV